MEKIEIFEKVKSILLKSDKIELPEDIPAINLTTDLTIDLGMDMVDIMYFQLLIEEEFQINPKDSWPHCNTFSDICQVISDTKNEKYTTSNIIIDNMSYECEVIDGVRYIDGVTVDEFYGRLPISEIIKLAKVGLAAMEAEKQNVSISTKMVYDEVAKNIIN